MTDGIEALIEFWKKAPLDKHRYVHPDDQDQLKERFIHEPIFTSDDYGLALREGRLQNSKLHLTLLPTPYLGDLRNARVAILLLNPGLDATNFHTARHFPNLDKIMRGVIHQTTPYNPFLDPKWAWTSGFQWWERKLRGVAQIISKRNFNADYGKTLDLLSKEIACIELVSYHSTSFGGPTNLPSAQAAREAALEIASNANRTVIVTRSAAKWNLPAANNIITYGRGQARGASLSEKSSGGQAILRAFDAL